MKILFSTFGSLGDIHPYLALALEARARGHQPILATSEKYRFKTESLGLEFRSVRPDLPEASEFGDLAKRVMDSKRGPEYLFKELLNPTLRQNYADLVKAGADVDLIVTHPAAMGGPLAAQKLEKKWVSSALAPISLWSIYDPPTPPTLPGLDFLRMFGPLWGMIFKRMGEAATRGWVSEVEAIRREENLGRGSHPVFDGQHSPHGVLALFSPHFCSPQRDWPNKTEPVGFPFFDQSGYALSASELDSNSKNPTISPVDLMVPDAPIVFTLGSSAVWDAGEFFQLGADYSARLEKNAVFLTGQPTGIKWPAHVTELIYAPYSELFPRAGLVVHQGGIGTVAQCLRAGVPQVVMPYAHDQNDNARRVEKTGVGRKISRSDYARNRGEWALELLADSLENCVFPARRLGLKIQKENAASAALDFMEGQLQSE